jgi:hypothetical protein
MSVQVLVSAIVYGVIAYAIVTKSWRALACVAAWMVSWACWDIAYSTGNVLFDVASDMGYAVACWHFACRWKARERGSTQAIHPSQS